MVNDQGLEAKKRVLASTVFGRVLHPKKVSSKPSLHSFHSILFSSQPLVTRSAVPSPIGASIERFKPI
jgi:hypothetical protein